LTLLLINKPNKNTITKENNCPLCSPKIITKQNKKKIIKENLSLLNPKMNVKK
jgi:DNA-directed RNA polymerase subunit RPC12/RpoP